MIVFLREVITQVELLHDSQRIQQILSLSVSSPLRQLDLDQALLSAPRIICNQSCTYE
jgi:hypothetical protein